jgi:site-specific recombinase XerD
MLESGRDPIWLQQAPASETKTIAEAVALFIQSCRGNIKESTIRSYATTLAFLDGALPLDVVKVEYLEAHRATRKINARSWKKELIHIRALFKFCAERKYISENPAKLIRLPKVHDLVTLPFSRQDVAALLAACDRVSEDRYARGRARALVLTLLYSGLRISDTARLERAALEPTGHLVLEILKTGVAIKILLNPAAVKALTAMPATNAKYFFWDGRDLHSCIGDLSRLIEKLGKLTGIHAHPHRFRDTFAVEVLTTGSDMRTLQKLLGHKSIRTTERHYAQFVAAHQALLDNAAALLDFERSGRPLLLDSLHNRRRNA